MKKMLITVGSMLFLTFASTSTTQTPAPAPAAPQTNYEFDFLIKGGHVIDPRNKLSAVRDVGIKDGKVTAVAANIAATRALKSVDATGLYVTPGLVDIHVHLFVGTKKNDYASGDWSVFPDGFTLRSCVTTVADAGSPGWRNFEEFKTPDHRPSEDPRDGVPQHRRRWHGIGPDRTEPGRHGSEADRGYGAEI